MPVWVPPKVAQELAEEQRGHYRAVLFPLFDFDDPVCRQWNPELRKLDPHIRIGRAKPMAYVPGVPVRPGFYHFLRDNPGAPPTVSAITGADDEWVEPDSGLLRKLQSNDLQNPAVIVAMRAEQERIKEEEERDKLRDREARQGEILERWAAGTRTQVSLNPDVPWSQNAAGRRARKPA